MVNTDESIKQPTQPAEEGNHLKILRAIKAILLESNAPFKTVHVCITFVDHLIDQSLTEEEKKRY